METKELNERQKAILSVPPMIWKSSMGGLIFQLQIVRDLINSQDSKEAITQLDSITKQIEGISNFLVTGQDH